MTNAFSGLPGAVLAATTPEVAEHYGAPLQEQRLLEAGSAVVDLAHRGVLRVSGDDRLRWLNSMLSQRLDNLAPGDSSEALLLDPNGRIEHAIKLVDDGAATWLIVGEGEAEALEAFLLRMRFTMRVTVENLAASHTVIGAFAGPAAELLVAAAGAVIWRDPWQTVAHGGAQYADPASPHPASGWLLFEAIVPLESAEVVADQVRRGVIRIAGIDALNALEIRAWRPSLAAEVDERSIPHELDWLRSAVHLNKGCYRGQETVAKVHNLGHPPRRLAMLHLDGSNGELPAHGALVYPAGGGEAKPVGRVTRAALHHEWGGIALALLRRSVDESAAFEVELPSGSRVQASQEVIVPASAGKTRDVPRLKRI